MRIRTLAAVLAATSVLCAGVEPAAAQPSAEYEGAAGLGLSLRRLGVAKRVLMVGAHPDDEDTQLLAALALEQGADVAYLSLTRGEGGQNGIGPELHEALGLLRTEELLAARRVDGARQFFTRAYDFGFSRNAEETFRHWPREEVLRDVVYVVRRFRPDVIIPVFSGTPRDGHGHHQVSAILAREAFDAAADPARFPEQLATVRPHRTAKLYQSLRGDSTAATVRLAIGNLDPLIGRSPFQLAMASRSRHRSQDMGRPETAGPRWGYLRRILPAATGPERSMWEGIDTTVAGADRALARYGTLLGGARVALNPGVPDAGPRGQDPTVALLASALGALRTPQASADPDAAFRRAAEMRDAEDALARAAGLVLDAVADDARLVPGQTFALDVSLWNGGRERVAVAELQPRLPAGWTAEAAAPLPGTPLEAGAILTRRFRVSIPADAAVTEPYFLRRPRQGDLYGWPTGDSAVAEPFEAAPVRASARLAVAGAELPMEREATFREVDLRQGELRRPVMVVPAVSVSTERAVRILPLAGDHTFRMRVDLASEAPGGIAGTLRLELPAGWSAQPASLPVRFAAAGDEQEAEFTVRAPASLRAGDYPMSAVFQAADGRRFTRAVRMVDYPHVRARPLYSDAATLVRAFDVRVPAGLRVAYIEGAGEEGPGVLEQLGIRPTLLDDDALAGGDLDRFDVIVAGSRAYEVRPDLARHNARLLEWVRRGGTMVVQYNKYELVEGNFAPYPLTMARPHDRVTDENAPVRLLAPAHPVFTTPNRITGADFEGWVQERGLYFARTWDPRYTPLLETGDPGAASLQGGLLAAKVGQGTYVYTGLAFFRQLPEGVPGAWRLFANLLALGKAGTRD
jgi:LmbE family N-acetylglucosaminyl deacetylase